MKRAALVLALVAVGGVGCRTTTAMDVCIQFVHAGFATHCHEVKPEGLGASAVERVEFTLEPPYKNDEGGEAGGSVLRYDSKDKFENVIKSYEEFRVLAGPHRYENRSKMIFVQMNSGASMDIGRKAKGIVEGL